MAGGQRAHIGHRQSHAVQQLWRGCPVLAHIHRNGADILEEQQGVTGLQLQPLSAHGT